ncbi:hypothetical protein HAX54_046916 [Datura stramonium]|uniref:Uncharacterized protein n=1 Tax=Datura stramonium TaxID=4076 RepID=A0ABS8SS11_DATST|nr:hypothetical protein [Datura stramonium]
MSTLLDRMCSSVSVDAFGSIIDEMKHLRDECNGQVPVTMNDGRGSWTIDEGAIEMSFEVSRESLEKLMDVTREELPDTMVAALTLRYGDHHLTMELDINLDLPAQVINTRRKLNSSRPSIKIATLFKHASIVLLDI